MSTKIMRNIGKTICRPFKYIGKGAAGMLRGAAKSTQKGIKKGIRNTGEAAGRMIWDNKFESLYAEIQNNIYIKTGVGLIWLLLFVWAGYNVYAHFPANANKAFSFSFAGYTLAAVLILCCFLRDVVCMAAWHKRGRIRENITSFAPERLKKFLLAQKLPAFQKTELAKKFVTCKDNKTIVAAYEETILNEMDDKADAIIEKYSKTAGIGNFVSPRWSWDYLLTVAAFAKMLCEIAKVYQVRLSVKSFVCVFVFGMAVIAASVLLARGIKQIADKNQTAIAMVGGIGAWLAGKIIGIAIPCCTLGAIGYAVRYAFRPLKP